MKNLLKLSISALLTMIPFRRLTTERQVDKVKDGVTKKVKLTLVMKISMN